jgi:hypothetical protein
MGEASAMFHFFGRLSPSAFAIRAWAAVALCAAVAFALPSFVFALLSGSACDDACGIVSSIIFIAVKSVFFFGFVAFLIGIGAPRARDLGLPAVVSLFLPLLVLADTTFGMILQPGWTASVVPAFLPMIFPSYLLAALALLIYLSIAPSNSLHVGNHPRLQQLALAIAIIIGAGAVVRMLPLWARLMIAGRPSYWVTMFDLYAPLLMAPLLGILSVLAWLGRVSPPAEMTNAAERPPVSLQWKIKHAVAITATITVAFYLVDSTIYDPGMTLIVALISLPLQLIPTLFPSFLLYLAPTCSIMQLRAERSARSFTFLAASLIPFVLWGVAIYQAYESKKSEISEVAAIPRMSIDHIPSTLVVSNTAGSTPVFCDRIRERVPEIKEMIHETNGRRFEAEDCTSVKRGQRGEATKIDNLPDEYLRLKTGRKSSFAKPGQMYGAMGEPLELRYVAPGRDDLIAVSFEAFDPYPCAPPMLGASGWLRQSGSANYEDVITRVHAFITDSLSHAVHPS